MATRSPYFDQVCTETPSPRSRSDYFAQSRTSFFGSTETLGSLVEGLGGKVDNIEDASARCCRDVDGKQCIGARICSACQHVLDPVVALFQDCPMFCQQWNEVSALTAFKDKAGGVKDTCWHRMEPHLEDCVRHLCNKQCFLRAFTPYRQRFALQRRLTESTDIDPSHSAALLDGWSCRLVAASRPPRILFEDCDGRRFESISRVLHFSEKEASTTDQASSRKRKRQESSLSLARRQWKYPHVSLATSVRSPLGLLEELFAQDPWCLLLSTIFLNRTSRVQVDHVWFEFLERWPSAKHVLGALADEIVDVIRPLGICFRRANGIKRFSRDYLTLQQDDSKDVFCLTEADVKGLHQCGSYAFDAYRIFIQRDLRVDPSDLVLKTYIEYKAGLDKCVDLNTTTPQLKSIRHGKR